MRGPGQPHHQSRRDPLRTVIAALVFRTVLNPAGGMTVLEDVLAVTKAKTAETRRARKALQMAKPIIYMYKNNPDQSAGLVYCGRINYRELPRYEFPKKKNV